MTDTLTALLPINLAYAEDPLTGATGLPQILLLVGFAAIFYFLIIRPQSKRAKAHKQLVSSLGVGDEVITSGGLMGRVVKVHDDSLEVELASNLTVHMQKTHITSILPKGTMKFGK